MLNPTVQLIVEKRRAHQLLRAPFCDEMNIKRDKVKRLERRLLTIKRERADRLSYN